MLRLQGFYHEHAFVCCIAFCPSNFLLYGWEASCQEGGYAARLLFSREKCPAFPLTMTFLATIVGGGVVLGAAEEAYKFGWAVLFYPLGSSLGLILLGLGVGRKLAEFQVSTVAQIFEVAYKSTWLKRTASVLSVVSLFMILSAQIIASGKFMASLGLNNTALFVAFWLIVIVYTAQGGLKGVISTDIVQGAFFSAIFLICFGFVLYSDASLDGALLGNTEGFTLATSKMCGWLLMPLFYMVIGQDMGQRCFAGDSPGTVSKATLLAGIATMVVGVVPVFFGSLAKAMHLEVPKGSSVLMAAIASTSTPLLTALVGCAVLAAIVSTASSLINAIGSNLSSDFKPKQGNQIISTRGFQYITCVISLAAIVFAFYFDNVVDLLIECYDLSISCMFIPVFFALYKRQGNYLAAMMSMVCGALGFFLLRVYPMEFPKEIASILLSLVGYGAGELLALCSVKESSQTILQE